MLYDALFGLAGTCLAILTIALAFAILAYLFGFFGTRLRANKENEWAFAYSFRAVEFEIKKGTPVDRGRGIYFSSLTTCTVLLVLAMAVLRWFVIVPSLQDIYDSWFILYRSMDNESALAATASTVKVLMLASSFMIGFAMRRGRRRRIKSLREKNTVNGREIPVRSRCILSYPICFLGTAAEALCEKLKKSSVAKR